jgi:molybdopterin synthase catalytic subunit
VSERIDLRESALSLDEVVAHVTRPGAGGIATFVGVVRDESDGRAVTRLDYSAYAAMAKREMTKIADELEKEIEGVRVSAIHRVGALGVGDAAIICAASAPHRGEAFKACRELIDRIKARGWGGSMRGARPRGTRSTGTGMGTGNRRASRPRPAE